ncbi:dihydrofolate reductase family protein [Chelativorans intermedius]|uniref:Dihydrofolate reductase family protein n=1 Tax=Chelativorans intermedius TaxID=515947 RepID=A0ABV6D997_9HYPH|nr:dihydrofolate reductase family protein [Chelativorans intermedius]MCT8999976.1 dihydrofolate reductase family protein [Chelativorans intermedius]
MRRLVVWNMMTLDGHFEGKTPWDLGFHELVWGDELESFSLEQGKEIGTLLFGRRTYEGMASYWKNETGAIAEMMNAVEKAVATRTLGEVTWNNTRLLKGEAAQAVRALKTEEGKDIYVFGSAQLLTSLLEAGLVDEYRICVVPVVLGGGNPLFKPLSRPVRMHLASTRPLKTGGVVLTYAVGS